MTVKDLSSICEELNENEDVERTPYQHKYYNLKDEDTRQFPDPNSIVYPHINRWMYDWESGTRFINLWISEP